MICQDSSRGFLYRILPLFDNEMKRKELKNINFQLWAEELFSLKTWYLLGWWCLRNPLYWSWSDIRSSQIWYLGSLFPPPFFFSSNGYHLKGKRVITLPQQSLMMLVSTVDRSELPKSPVEVGSFYLPLFYQVWLTSKPWSFGISSTNRIT